MYTQVRNLHVMLSYNYGSSMLLNTNLVLILSMIMLLSVCYIRTYVLFYCSFHPYIFFTKDYNSLIFIGFNINHNGDLINPATKKVFHKQLLTRQLLRGLETQKVTFTDDESNDE